MNVARRVTTNITWNRPRTVTAAKPSHTAMTQQTPAHATSIDRSPTDSLPPLSAADFQAYNHMASHMDYFHNHFRSEWNELYSAVSSTEWGHPSNKSNSAPVKQLSASRIISVGNSFLSHLTMHHSIEEQHIFPVLARKMPAFQKNSRHIQQHREIHAGLDKLEQYLSEVRLGERELRRQEIKDNMDSWGGVLWEHLDEEVQTLGAENMRKYWTMAEMQRMPM